MKAGLRSTALGVSATAFRMAERLGGGLGTRVLMRHRFVFDESRADSLNRLRRELAWLKANFTVISLSDFSDGLIRDSLPDNALIFTTDDVHLDVFEVFEVFREFEMPLSMFVPLGWTASLPPSLRGTLIEAVTLLQWYEGEPISIDFGKGENISISETSRSESIDWLLDHGERLAGDLPELCDRLAALPGSHVRRQTKRTTCSWEELEQMNAAGVEMASHSISHPRLSQMSTRRRRFELIESKRVIETHFGPCSAFAYPYGTPDSHSDASRQSLEEAGYSCAFLTHSDVVTTTSPRFSLPRICIPDSPIPFNEFRARTRGGGIILQRVRKDS